MKISDNMLKIGGNAVKASQKLRILPTEKKNEALTAIKAIIFNDKNIIIEENKKDMEFGLRKNLSEAMLDRLYIDKIRLSQIIDSLNNIITLPDPVGSIVNELTRPNGLIVKRIRTPIGVIGVIFESRPNVFVDAGALCFKSGNASVLRCGSESYNTSIAFEKCFRMGFKEVGITESAVQLVPTRDRSAVEEMLIMSDHFDVIIPRGGKGLVGLVQDKARVPIFAHLEGIVHIYVHADADPIKARKVILNSKLRRPGICGAVECLLIDEQFINKHGTSVISDLVSAGVCVKVSDDLMHIDGVVLAEKNDWGKEFLSMAIAVRTVSGMDKALSHIQSYGSNHTDCIVTENNSAGEKFFLELDSAILMRNASTQFADGGEFGFGAEIGIATGKLHARGPVGLEQLTSFKYTLNGDGQTRP